MPHLAPQHRPHRLTTSATRSAELRERDRFYKRAAWIRFRKWFLSQPENVLCAECRREEASEVDHVLTLASRPDLALDPTNCRGLCASCHSKRTRCDQLAKG